MKISFGKRITAFLFALLLLASGANAASVDMAGLDSALSDWLDTDSALGFSVSLELNTLMPFTQRQTDMMNRLLSHLTFSASLEQDGGDSFTALSLSCGEEPLFTLSERETGDRFALETSLLPDRVLESQGISVTDRLLGSSADSSESPDRFDLLTAVSEAEIRYHALIEACLPFAESKKANYKIKNIGTAKWGQIARLTPEQSDSMLPLLRGVLQSGFIGSHKEVLEQIRFGKGFVVALYKQEESGADLAVYMKGTVIFPDGATAPLAYQWAFTTGGDVRKDTYRYDLNRSGKSPLRYKAEGTLTRKSLQSEFLLQGKSTLSAKTGSAVTITQTETLDLSGTESEVGRTLNGQIAQQTKGSEASKDLVVTTALTPSLTLDTVAGGTILSGTVLVENTRNKVTTQAMTLTFGAPLVTETEARSLYAVAEDPEAPPASIFQNMDEDPGITDASAHENDFLVGKAPIGLTAYTAPARRTTLSLADNSEAAISALRGELSQNLASKLLLALATLPQEDFALLQDGMTDEDFQQFLALLRD